MIDRRKRRTDKVTINYIFLFYHIKQIDPTLPWICSVIDHRRRQNMRRTSVTHLAAFRAPLPCPYHI